MQERQPTEEEHKFAQEASQGKHTQVGIIGNTAQTLGFGGLLMLGSVASIAAAHHQQQARKAVEDLTPEERARAQVQSGQASIEARERLERLKQQGQVVGRTKGGTTIRRHQKAKSAAEPFTILAKDRDKGSAHKIRDLSANDALSSMIALIGVALESGGSLKLDMTDANGKPVAKVEISPFESGVSLPLMDDLREANQEDNL